MLAKIKLLSNSQYCLRQNFSSALFITGDKAQKTFAVLTPVIDFEEQLNNKVILQKNLKARDLPLDLEKIEKRWQFFQSIDKQRRTLETTKAEIGKSISKLLRNSDENEEEIEKLKLHSRLIKDDLKNIKEFYYDLEEGTVLQVLNLPNVLHDKTPIDPVSLHTFLKTPKEKSKSHMEIGMENKVIEYINPFICYFKADAALFEMSISNYFRHCLLNLGYTQFSSPDFCRTIIVEGCGLNSKEMSNIFTLEEPDDEVKDEVHRLHLCGGASLYPFMAYFTRHSVEQTHFPIRYFSLGKKYQPFNSEAASNLYNVCQETVVNIFIATVQEEDELENITKQVIELYESLGYHFKVIILPANKLQRAESLRLSVQMYSNYLEDYVEVGHVSLYDSYLSKRLLFNYSVNKERKYPKVIAGTLLNVPKLLGCVLENNSVTKESLLTDLLRKYMFI